MANIYLQVEFGSGTIFQYSKTNQEGYESHINTKGTESWRKFYKKGLYAKLESVSVRDTDFGKEISIATKLGNGDSAYLNFPLLDQKKNLASYAESFITILPSLKVGESYRFFPYNIKGENDKYANIGMSVVLANLENESVVEGVEKPVRLTYSYTSKDGKEVKGDIPAVVWEEDFDGSKTMNSKAKNKFLYDVLTKHTSGNTESSTQAPVPTQKVEAPKAEVKKDVPTAHDDLPF
jgi:hypothetical protein